MSVFLLLDDADVQFVDTNQFESVLRDIEVGTLTQTATATGKVGGKKTNYGAATMAGSLSSLPVQDLSPELGFSYVDALQRKLREQLNFRSASIEADGQIFRLVHRSSVENQIPSMSRQILTLQFQRRVLLARANYTQSGGKLSAFSVGTFVQPQFCGVKAETARDNYDMNYEIKATPFILTAVRRIRNEGGVKTLGLDDDDRITYDIHLDVKPKTVMTTVPVRQWAIQLKIRGDPPQTRFLHVVRNAADQAATLTFASDLDASWFAVYLKERLRLNTLSAEDRESGNLFVGLEAFPADTTRFGVLDEKGRVGFRGDIESIEPKVWPFGMGACSKGQGTGG